MYGKEGIRYKELAYAILEAVKSQHLHSASWRPKRAGGILSVRMHRDPGEPIVQILPKACRLKTQEEPPFWFKSLSRKITHIPARRWAEGIFLAFLICLGLQLIGWGPYTLGRIIFYSKTRSQAHQNYLWPNIWSTQWPFKLTHKINHHSNISYYYMTITGSTMRHIISIINYK